MSTTQGSRIDNPTIVSKDIEFVALDPVSGRALWNNLSSEKKPQLLTNNKVINDVHNNPEQDQQRLNYIDKIEKYLNQKIKNDECKIISQGRDYDVIIYHGMVYRFPKAGKEFNLSKEKRILDTIRPYVSLTIPDFTIVDNSFIIYPCIEGQTLNRCDVNYGDDFVQTFVGFIKELHSIPLDTLDFLRGDDEIEKQQSQFQGWVASLQDEMLQRLAGRVPDHTITKLQNYIHELFINYQSPTKAFVHGDLHGKNILYDQQEQKIVGIIDFTGSKIGGVELDFCRFAYRDDDLLERMVIAYLGQIDQGFIDRVKFWAKKTMIRQIKNDDMYYNNFQGIIDRLKKYEFM